MSRQWVPGHLVLQTRSLDLIRSREAEPSEDRAEVVGKSRVPRYPERVRILFERQVAAWAWGNRCRLN